jgi:hypothetical protein
LAAWKGRPSASSRRRSPPGPSSDRIEREIDKRIDERLATRTPAKRGPSPLHPGNLGVCIPIIVLAGVFGHTAGVVVALCALALVFLVAELRR